MTNLRLRLEAARTGRGHDPRAQRAMGSALPRR